MAVLSLHFPVGEVTLAQRLRAMLATCETEAAFSTWCGDYLQFADKMPFAEQRDLTATSVRHLSNIRRAAA